MFFEHFKLQIRDIIFFFRKFQKSQKFKIGNDLFINATALRAPPGSNQVDGSPPAPSLLPGNRTEAISRNLNITIDEHEFS